MVFSVISFISSTNSSSGSSNLLASWLMDAESLMPHLQVIFNNSYSKLTQPNSSYLVYFLRSILISSHLHLGVCVCGRKYDFKYNLNEYDIII